ncbi:MAG: hypothetical protein TU35_001800 [Thermoproteus sp. AZ2]|jgi:hypothetical protein|uniref:Uncharacterized protein n=1 Tax=Thermoproteus sp. AZ2 TaxID=1609232 RepID=A0ACC6UYW1_9CREN
MHILHQALVFYRVAATLYMYKCYLCGRSDTALLEGYVKGVGAVLLCPDCWRKLAEENKLLAGASGGCNC